MQILSIIIGVILAGYIASEVIRFVPRYRKLKQAVAEGNPHARTRVYRQALAFEWISALLAVIALGFDWSKLNPRFLALEGSGLFPSMAAGKAFARGNVVGVLIGMVAGTAAIVIGRIRANRRSGTQPAQPTSRWKKILPDFSALIPVTTAERLWWVAVALSAGICEEVVFRGWLLAALHGQAGVNGTALIATAAVLFGLAHAYQGVTGMLLTALAGALFCGLYVATGSLLVPILLHCLVDVRFAVMPAPRIRTADASFA